MNPALSKAVFEEDLCGLRAPCSLPREAALSHAALSFAGYVINLFGLGVNTFYKDYYQSKLTLASKFNLSYRITELANYCFAALHGTNTCLCVARMTLCGHYMLNPAVALLRQ